MTAQIFGEKSSTALLPFEKNRRGVKTDLTICFSCLDVGVSYDDSCSFH